MHIYKVAAHTLGIDHSKVSKLCIVYKVKQQNFYKVHKYVKLLGAHNGDWNRHCAEHTTNCCQRWIRSEWFGLLT